MRWMILMAVMAMGAGATTQPSEDQLAAAVRADQENLATAEAACLRKAHATPEYTSIAADAKQKAAALEAARSADDPQAKLAASRENILALKKLKDFDAKSPIGDPGVTDANVRLASDQAALTDLQSEIRRVKREAQEKIDAEAKAKKDAEDNTPTATAIREHHFLKGMTKQQAMQVLQNIGPVATKKTQTDGDGVVTISWDYYGVTIYNRDGSIKVVDVSDGHFYRRVRVYLQDDKVIDFQDLAIGK